MARHDAPASSHANATPSAVVVLEKGLHRWRFECAAGEERDLMDAVVDLAAAPESRFDLQDAAVVCREIEALRARGGRRSVIRQNDPSTHA